MLVDLNGFRCMWEWFDCRFKGQTPSLGSLSKGFNRNLLFLFVPLEKRDDIWWVYIMKMGTESNDILTTSFAVSTVVGFTTSNWNHLTFEKNKALDRAKEKIRQGYEIKDLPARIYPSTVDKIEV